ncbi:MAG: PilZ domain-containing protein, partial [Acidimicrobiia bacterium]|nr:PilZ domain-containing protein [Acidimicrobiia bacterium]
GEHIEAGTDLEVAIVVSPSATALDVERSIVGLQATDDVARVTVLVEAGRRSELLELSRHWDTLAIRLVLVNDRIHRRAVDRLDLVLDHTEYPWVLWLEAGQVPMPDMVGAIEARTIGERVAVNQIAVGLLNPQSLVHVDRAGDEQALERRLVGPARAERGLAPWHGPGSLLRRAAFVDHTVVDDPSTSVLSRYAVELKRAGWRFDYDPRPVIRVPAADSLKPYLAERRQRSLAALEELGLSWTIPDVAWPIRRAALAAAMSTTHGLRQLGILVILGICLIVGRLPVAAATTSVLATMAGYSAASMLARRMLSGGTMGFGDWVKHGWRTLGADIAALTPRFARPLQLLHPGVRLAHRGSLGRMQFLILAFVAFELALIGRALATLYPIVLPAMGRRDAAVLLIASVGATIGLFAVLGGLARDQGRRRSPRVELETEIIVAGAAGTTLDITPSGLGALVDSAPPIGTPASFQFTITGHGGAERRIEATGTIRSATLHESGSVRIGLEFDDISIQDRMAITEYCALGLSSGPSFSESNADHLVSEVSFGQLALVRALAGFSVVAAAGAVMLGPQAGAVAANSATTIPPVFTIASGGPADAVSSPEMTVRLHIDGWSEPLSVNDAGLFERGTNPETWDGPVHVEVALGDDRHVELLPVDGVIRLAVVDVAAESAVTASLVGPGGAWRSVVAGDPLVPGPYTVRWSVGDEEPRTVAVRVLGGETLEIRPDGVSVLSAPAEDPDPTEETPTTATTPPAEDSTSTSAQSSGSNGRGRSGETPAATRPPLTSSTNASSTNASSTTASTAAATASDTSGTVTTAPVASDADTSGS